MQKVNAEAYRVQLKVECLLLYGEQLYRFRPGLLFVCTLLFCTIAGAVSGWMVGKLEVRCIADGVEVGENRF